MNKGGRPTDYTPELGDAICGEIAKGTPLVKVCLDESLPCTSTVYTWLRLHKEFLDNYTRAREDQADHFADEMISISDSASPEEVQKAKLQIDTRKWVSSKILPKKYGDKITQEHTGANGAPLDIVINHVPANKSS